MEEAGMAQYWFEIFRQTYDGWSWHFVEVRDGRRRVLARSERDYGSRKKARKSVNRFMAALQGAQIMPGSGYRLPASRFAVDYGVVPLMAGVSRRGPRPRRKDRRERMAVAVQRQEPAAAEETTSSQDQKTAAAGPSEPELAAQAARSAQETKRPAARRRRGTKTT
jgi:hypothetical protein